MKGAYLSIDLDFWMNKGKRSANLFFKKVFYKVHEFNTPLKFVIEHEELLNDVNETDADLLYNVDFHSDLCEDKAIDVNQEPTDGTWVNFVDWKHKGTYVWVCSDYKKCYINDEGTCTANHKNDPFLNKSTRWNDAIVTDRLNMINWNEIKRIGVCLSPFFVDQYAVEDIVLKFGIEPFVIDDLVKQSCIDHKERKRGILKELIGV